MRVYFTHGGETKTAMKTEKKNRRNAEDHVAPMHVRTFLGGNIERELHSTLMAQKCYQKGCRHSNVIACPANGFSMCEVGHCHHSTTWLRVETSDIGSVRPRVSLVQFY